MCRCGKEINDSNLPQAIIENGKRVIVCSDCYFDAFGEEIDEHPIVNPQLVMERRARRN